MKYLFQFGIIISITLIGELLYLLLPFPIPASIWGLVLMLLLLITKVVKLEKIEEAGAFLIQIMPIIFVPAMVGLVTSWSRVQAIIFPLIIIIVVTTVAVMAVSGIVTQLLMGKEENEYE